MTPRCQVYCRAAHCAVRCIGTAAEENYKCAARLQKVNKSPKSKIPGGSALGFVASATARIWGNAARNRHPPCRHWFPGGVWRGRMCRPRAPTVTRARPAWCRRHCQSPARSRHASATHATTSGRIRVCPPLRLLRTLQRFEQSHTIEKKRASLQLLIWPTVNTAGVSLHHGFFFSVIIINL